jgi:hypothetical protein
LWPTPQGNHFELSALIPVKLPELIHALTQNEEWLVDTAEIEFGEVLGTGGYGEVRKAIWRGTEVAVKTLLAVNATNETRNAFIDEVRVMTTLRHPHVVLFMAASTKPPKLCIGTSVSSTL